MTKINPGSIWKMAKNPNGGGYIVRSAFANHTSPKVAAVNRKLAEVAASCKGGKNRAEFRSCVAEKMKGFRAS